jgi:hypothetical protein
MACEESITPTAAMPAATRTVKQKMLRNRTGVDIRFGFLSATQNVLLESRRGCQCDWLCRTIVPWATHASSRKSCAISKGRSTWHSPRCRAWVRCMTSKPRPRGWCWWTVYAVALEFAAGRRRARVRRRLTSPWPENIGAFKDGNCIDAPALARHTAVATHPPPQYKGGTCREIYHSRDKSARAAGPRLATSQRIAAATADRSIVTAGNKPTACCDNILKT